MIELLLGFYLVLGLFYTLLGFICVLGASLMGGTGDSLLDFAVSQRSYLFLFFTGLIVGLACIFFWLPMEMYGEDK